MNEWFVRTALYRNATSKWTPIICFLFRTTFHFGVVIKGCRCVVSSVNCMMLFLHLFWFGFALIEFSVLVLSPLSFQCLSGHLSVLWHLVSFPSCRSILLFIYLFILIQRKMVEHEHVWSCQVSTKCTLWPFFVNKILVMKMKMIVKIPQLLWKYRILNDSIKQ